MGPQLLAVSTSGTRRPASAPDTGVSAASAPLAYQCVDVVKRFAQMHHDPQYIGIVGCAANMWGLLERDYDYVGYENGRTRQAPQVGDIIIWTQDNWDCNTRFGHVAIVADIGDTELLLFEQNIGITNAFRTVSVNRDAEGRWNVDTTQSLGTSFWVKGWLRYQGFNAHQEAGWQRHMYLFDDSNDFYGSLVWYDPDQVDLSQAIAMDWIYPWGYGWNDDAQQSELFSLLSSPNSVYRTFYTYNFAGAHGDPVSLTLNGEQSEGNELARDDMAAFGRIADPRLGAAYFDVFEENVDWSANFALRSMLFEFSGGRTTAVVHAAYEHASGVRYVNMCDPDLGQWRGWEFVSN